MNELSLKTTVEGIDEELLTQLKTIEIGSPGYKDLLDACVTLRNTTYEQTLKYDEIDLDRKKSRNECITNVITEAAKIAAGLGLLATVLTFEEEGVIKGFSSKLVLTSLFKNR